MLFRIFLIILSPQDVLINSVDNEIEKKLQYSILKLLELLLKHYNVSLINGHTI